MNIHEYQAKKILSRFGVLIPEGRIAYTPNEAKNAAISVFPRGPWMLKAQIQSGAREKGHFIEETAGKGGGIRLIKRRRDLSPMAKQMMGVAYLIVPGQSAAARHIPRWAILPVWPLANTCPRPT